MTDARQDFTEAELAGLAGTYLHDGSVQLITAPKWYEEEVVVGTLKGEWRCLANVNGALCVVVVNVYRKDHAHD